MSLPLRGVPWSRHRQGVVQVIPLGQPYLGACFSVSGFDCALGLLALLGLSAYTVERERSLGSPRQAVWCGMHHTRVKERR